MATPPGPLAGVVVPPVVVPPVAARSPGSAHVDGGNSWWDSVLSNFGEGGHTSLSAEPRGNDGVPLLLESPHDVGAVASQCPTGLALLNAPTATCGAGGENAFPQAGTSRMRRLELGLQPAASTALSAQPAASLAIGPVSLLLFMLDLQVHPKGG